MRKVLVVALALALAVSMIAPALAEHKGRVTFDVSLTEADKAERAELWLPYPLSDANQTITDMDIQSNGAKVGVESNPQSGAVYLHAVWEKPGKTPKLTMSFNLDSHYAKNADIKETMDGFPQEVLKYLKATPSLPIDQGFCADASAGIKDDPSILERARKVYAWVIEHTFRDESVKEGCGHVEKRKG